jgi:hypothetical protein
LKPSVVPGDCQLVRATTKRKSVGGRVCGSKGSAPTRLTALHDSSEPPRVRLRARGDSRRRRRYPRSARRRPTHAGCIPHEPRGLIAAAKGHTPTKTESARNPVPPVAQKVLDRRRRFTLIRLGTLLNKSYALDGVSARVRLGTEGSAEARGAGLLPSTSTVRRATTEGRRR